MRDGLKDSHRKTMIDILASNPRVERVVLFGSRAMGTFTTTSDVDLVLYGDKLTLTDQSRLARFIEELPMAQRVDLLLYRTIDNEKLKEHIKKHGVEWFRRGDGINANWPIHKVSELEKKNLLLVQDGNHGEYRPRTTEFVTDGIAFIRAADLGDGVVQFDTAEKINDVAFRRIRKGIGADFDTILSTKGTVGKLSFVPASSPKFVCSPQTTFWRSLKHDFIAPKFLYYELQSQHFLNQIRSRKGETDMADYLSLTSQRQLDIRVPDIKTQNKIIRILDPIDGKIQLNRQINQTLEEMAQAIFKSWFVDFDPVKAKIKAKDNGQDPERAAMCAISSKIDAELDQLPPDQLAQLRTTAALFPDELIDSEFGLIPKGWKAGCIGDVAVAKGGYAYKSVIFIDVGHPVVKIKNIVGDGTVNLDECQCIDDDQAQATNRFKLYDGDLLMAMTGATVGKVGLVVLSGKNAYLNQRVAKFESSQFGPGISWFLFCAFLRQSIFEQVVGSAQGSAQPNISSKGIESTKLVIPSTGCLREFIAKVEPLFLKWMSNQNEIKNLALIRDTLLPKLLSGEIEIGTVPSFS